ncbi:MAG: gamma carbonic anhydrase family protein [Rickettsiales bacterium]|nr:MAG: gamma carbonic anhydrase family protein [Rickettsiales bacterium]
MTYKLLPYRQSTPRVDSTTFLADGCAIIGNVTIKSNSSIWFNTVIRGDVDRISIGSNTNIQDLVVIHTSRKDGGYVDIGDNVTVGHSALLHACSIEDNAFIGMQSIIMDESIISEHAFIAAGSLVPAGSIVRSKELWMGRPAKYVRMVTDAELKFMEENARHYVELSKEHQLARDEPLNEI